MRRIDKGSEPPCLADLRRDALRIEKESKKPPEAKDWNPSTCVDPIRSALCHEQHFLCAYCTSRIKPRGYREELPHEGGMKIEHFEARKGHPRRMYDWDNMLGVCGGVYTMSSGPVYTCDKARETAALPIHPARRPPDPDEAFDFCANGSLEPRSEEAARMLEVLNLNAPPLRANRRAVIDELRKWLSRGRSTASLRQLYEAAATPGATGLPAYAPARRAYLERKMRAKGLL